MKSPITRHLSETLYTNKRHSLSSKQDELPDTDKKCLLRRSISASGRLGGELSRNVAAALVPYRVQSIRRKLLHMSSDATFRLSQPAIEMNLANLDEGSVSPGYVSPADGLTMFGFPMAAQAMHRRDSDHSSISPENSSSSSEPQLFSANRSMINGLMSPERDSRQETNMFRDSYTRPDPRVDIEHCDPRFDNRNVSPTFSSVDNDVIARTADRLCVITHGFYLCCYNQSRWDRR